MNFLKLSEESQNRYWQIGQDLVRDVDELDLSNLRDDHIEAAIWNARTMLELWQHQPPECWEENVSWHEMVYALEMFKMEQMQRSLAYATQSLADVYDKKAR